MKQMLIKRIGNLMSIKSIITVVLLLLFTYLAVKGVSNEQVNNLLTMVLTFYFGSKIAKGE